MTSAEEQIPLRIRFYFCSINFLKNSFFSLRKTEDTRQSFFSSLPSVFYLLLFLPFLSPFSSLVGTLASLALPTLQLCLSLSRLSSLFFWSQSGSNWRPPACKAGALPAELWPPNLLDPLAHWWAWIDLNYRPHAYQACALTNWATGPRTFAFCFF